MPRIALTREVSDAIARCELTHIARQPIDVRRARAQHAEYEAALRELGCRVERVPAAPEFPDAVFVEDAAIVFSELAVIARPGASSRRGETESVARTLSAYRRVVPIREPGTLDGGDVLVAGHTAFVGRSTRTNEAGIEQLRRAVSPLGYTVVPIPVTGCLHLKSAVTEVADGVLVFQPDWVAADFFRGFEAIAVAAGELYGANALRIGDRVIYPAGFPKTAERLAERLANRAVSLRLVEADELAKAEGAVTCCSLVFDA